MSNALAGKRGLVVGVANDHSIAWGVAAAMHAAGAELALTYLNAKAEPHVRHLAERLGATFFEPLDVAHEAAEEALFKRIAQAWGRLDILVHSIAFAAWAPTCTGAW
jgi:enoyl-[acyl-carrier protein] reductase I